MKKIMILGASILQLPAIEKARELNLDTIVVDMNPEAVGFNVEGIKKEIISTIDTPAVVEAAKKYQIDGIMTLATDMPMQTVAVVAEEMNLVGIDYDTAIRATNKAYMREALKNHNVPIPLFYRVNTIDEYYKAVDKIREYGYKCIVKPADNSGSRGIDLLSDYKQVTIDRAYEYSKKFSRSGELMIEEFMEGPEVSVETLSIGGTCHVIQITDKLTTGAPYFVEMGHSQPSQLSKEIKEKIKKVAIEANQAIGIKNGPSHTEIKVTKDGPKVVELGARLGGDNITTHLTPLSTGIDMVESCIKIALGEKVDIASKYSKASAIRYFTANQGRIKCIQGLENAKKIPGVVQISVVHGAGTVLHGIKSSGDRTGFVITQSDDVNKAILVAEKAMNMIRFEIN